MEIGHRPWACPTMRRVRSWEHLVVLAICRHEAIVIRPAVLLRLVPTSKRFQQARLVRPEGPTAHAGTVTISLAHRGIRFLQGRVPLAQVLMVRLSPHLASVRQSSRQWVSRRHGARCLLHHQLARVPRHRAQERMATVQRCLWRARRPAEARLQGRGCLQGLAPPQLVVIHRGAPAVHVRAPHRA